ncbi:MAG: hypothetical protein WC785_02725 [Tatlockia sp.]|jgi:hypothetical protein
MQQRVIKVYNANPVWKTLIALRSIKATHYSLYWGLNASLWEAFTAVTRVLKKL